MSYAACRSIPPKHRPGASTTARPITSARRSARRSSMPTPSSTPASSEVVDPVCGMTINPADAVGHVDYKGQTYYFCAESCLERFKADPEAYVKGSGIRDQGSGVPDPQSPIPHPPVATWTCPMHPEIVRDAPGSCPICGMALEPMTITAEE